VFIPRPRVESVLVSIERRERPAVETDPERMFTLVRAGFGQRRKMLRRSLAELIDAAGFERAGVRPDARAEELSIEDWGRLASV
jgi:16S rRNA (adenine1518-N6/adenine1519-N6)-dimethyltransferase